MARPVLFVLAGVNGAGKSSIGGIVLEQQGLTWFNPDTFARDLRAATRCDLETSNSLAWHEGMRRFDQALAKGRNLAFETTLGGVTVTRKVLEAIRTHDVLIWFCGLSSIELHIARVEARVAAGGHPIPEKKIRERYRTAVVNLIQLLPDVAAVAVYDNSAEAAADGTIPDPDLLLEVQGGKVRWPHPQDLSVLARTPAWAKPIVEAAIRMG